VKIFHPSLIFALASSIASSVPGAIVAGFVSEINTMPSWILPRKSTGIIPPSTKVLTA
jgi:hypothetical protein